MTHSVFNHVVAEKAVLYRSIMGIFVEAKAHFTVHLRPEDVGQRLGTEPLETIQAALNQLVHWGNLEADPDTARVSTVEEFYRASHLYQLTRAGEAAEQALQVFDRELGRRGALQTVALDDIRLRLRSLLQLSRQERPDPMQVQLLLRDLAHVFTDLAENARAFMSGLSRTLELRGQEEEALIAYKERLIGYIERFIGDLTTSTAEITGIIRSLDTPGEHGRPIDPLLDLASERDLEDRAPDVDDVRDPQTIRAEHHREARAHWEGHWEGLKRWFLDQPHGRAQAALLRAQARRAISQLLEAIQRLNARRLGRSDRSADFRTLARWFLECGDDGQAHRLWRAAFGLHCARHLGVDPDTLARWEEAPIPPQTPWREAPPLRISPRLRSTGRYGKRGALPRLRRRGREKDLLAAQVAQEAEQLRQARATLATGETLQLSTLGQLDRQAFHLLLRLLADALSSAERPDAPITTTTGDGSLRIELLPLGPGTQARIHTPDGILTGRDYRLRVTELESAP
ncbi:MAG: TIGR02677 family protein [Ectothiorhodospira sp.]